MKNYYCFMLLALLLMPICLQAQNKNNPYSEFKPLVTKQKTVATYCQLKTDDTGLTSTEDAKLLGHTPPELKRYIVDKDLIEIFVATSTISGEYFLDFKYIFNSAKGVSNYGGFGKGSPVKVTLLNKESLYFNNLRANRGKSNQKDGISYLTASYMLDDYELKQLQKSPIMTLEVTYEFGTELYEVENINCVRQQLNCLKQNKK